MKHELNISKSIGKLETIGTSEPDSLESSSIEILEANVDFIVKEWDKFAESFEEMLFEEEGVKPTLAALNNILSGIQSRELVMWLGVQYVGNKRIMLGFFITSKYVGGPAGSQFLHISYLRGLEQLPEEVWQEGFSTVMRHAISEGCNALVATTRHKHIVDIAKKLGAQIDNRIIWRI